jgi:hypothetical protein
MTTKNDLGTMGSNPLTGECFAACIDTPPPAEFDELMSQGALLERRPLSVIRDAFCEIAPSRQILHVGPSIGKYQGCDIPDWHETADGTRYRYVAVCGEQPDLRTLAVDQVVVAPGLIYERAP